MSTVEAEDALARLVDARRGSAAKPFVGRVEGGAVLQGTMRLHWAVAVFVVFSVWMGIVAAVSMLLKSGAGSDTTAVFFAVLFPVFVIILMLVGYFPERRKAMRLMVDTFAA